jgi:sigma-B regulation protein RsbU (phosphoserine phosphatase)
MTKMSYRADDRLELALQASNEGIWDWDLVTDEIHYSGRILRFLGRRRGEMPHFFRELDWIHQEDRENFRSELERVLGAEGEQLLAVEPRMRSARGRWRYYRIRGIVVRDAQGKALRMAGSMIDISRRKEAEEQLLEERHLMRLLIDNVPLNIYFKDLESRFTLVNQSIVKWLGAGDESGLLGKTDHDFFDVEHADQARRDEEQIIETGEPILGYLEREGVGDEDETWVLTTKMPLPDRKGNVIGTFGVSSDVTELVKTQRSLAEVAAKLQQRNNEMEEELSLAREVQQALLPKEYPPFPAGAIPEDNRLVFAHRYLPISGLAGDFFEVFSSGENAATLFICDVMGHGVRSAIIVSMLRGLLEQAESAAMDPAEFLTVLNGGLHSILKQARVTMFATAFVAVVDLEKNELRYASAGHPAGIVRTADGAHTLPLGADGPGPGLGLFADAKYGTQRADLAAIRHLLLYTDGIYEIENQDGEAFMENRLVEVVGEASGSGVEESLDLVLERVRDFAGRRQFDDDVCLLGMELR